MSSAEWQIGLLGEFLIVSPNGDTINIPSRKARALVALLALNNGIAVSRDWLGRQLWSDKPKLSQQQNLRQAVSVIPSELIEASRETCRLAVEYRCDALDCLNAGRDSGKAILLPEMPEEIFDSYRTELQSFAPTGELGDAARSAAGLLEWAVVHNPARIVELLQGCRELIPSMPLPVLEGALRAGLSHMSPDHPHFRWGMVQFATVLMWAGHCDEGIKIVKKTLEGWEPQRDDPDWTAAAYSAATFLIFRGRLDKALNFIESTNAMAETHGLHDAQRSFTHAKALWFGYGGDFDEALRLLESLPPSDIVRLHLAIYCALVNAPDKGRRALADISSSTLGNVRLESQFRVALGYLLLAEGKPREARVVFAETVGFCDLYGLQLVKIHSIEGLALLEVNPEEARRQLALAADLRASKRFPLLPGDRRRLATLLGD